MTLHDSYARFTPYELAFPDQDLLDELIVGINEENRAYLETKATRMGHEISQHELGID